MIDFEQEIEVRLRQFQYLTGRGNVKDCNKTLYEILRLMLGMLSQTEAVEPQLPDISEIPITPQPVAEDEAIEGEHAVITSDALERKPAATSTKSAPHGLTKFGNPRRIRNKKVKS